jgi:hypothetical protein
LQRALIFLSVLALTVGWGASIWCGFFTVMHTKEAVAMFTNTKIALNVETL